MLLLSRSHQSWGKEYRRASYSGAWAVQAPDGEEKLGVWKKNKKVNKFQAGGNTVMKGKTCNKESR